jgi:methyl-accepting chemotaxis protein
MKLTIRLRVIILAVIPVLILTVLLTSYGLMQSSALGRNAVSSFSEDLRASKENELKNYMELAKTSIKPLLSRPNSSTDEDIRQEAYTILRGLRFNDSGSDGYFFAYDVNGVNLMHGANQSLEGKNLISFQDPNGVYLIGDLIEQAKRGGGYVEYSWKNSDGGNTAPKLGYAVMIDEWNIVLGTGFWIDGLMKQRQEIESEIDDSITSTFTQTLVIAFIALLAIIFVALLVARGIVRPLRTGVEAMNGIATGDGDLTKRLATNTGCEVSDFGFAFNSFADQVQSIVKSVLISTQTLANATSELSDIVRSANQGLERQLVETDQVATAMTQMATAAQSVSSDANSASDAASEAEQQVKDAIQVLMKTIEAIQGLGNKVSAGVEAIRSLEQHSENIGGVLDVIRGVSEQTNLLALNAAIEAARAGEAGRGFAVVADEVRTLAARSQESTNQIQEMIENVQSGAQTAVGLIEEIYHLSDAVTEEVQNVDSSLQQIKTATNTITDMNIQIANAAGEQTKVSESINLNVSEIVAISNTNAEGTAKAGQVTEELNQMAGNLKDEVKRFKVQSDQWRNIFSKNDKYLKNYFPRPLILANS